MSNMEDFNSRLPSSADSLNGVEETLSNKFSAGTEGIRDAVAEAGERTGDVYKRSNDAVVIRIDRLIGVALGALAGYLVGYMMGTDHRSA